MWKQKQFIIEKVVYKLYITKKIHKKIIKVQRYRFQIELEKIKKSFIKQNYI